MINKFTAQGTSETEAPSIERQRFEPSDHFSQFFGPLRVVPTHWLGDRPFELPDRQHAVAERQTLFRSTEEQNDA